jgi:hypothetical protein
VRTEHGALVKSTMKILSNFVTFSENPNFTGHSSTPNCSTDQNRLKSQIMLYKESSPQDFIYNDFLVIGYYYLLESHCCKVSKVGITSKYPLHCSPFRVEILVILTFLIAGLFKNTI